MKLHVIPIGQFDCYEIQAKSPTPQAGGGPAGPPVNVPPPPCAPYCPLPGQVRLQAPSSSD